MADIEGFEKLTRRLKALGGAAGGAVLRTAANQAMLPAVKAARAAIPVGNPPYNGSDPYPVEGYQGILRTPGFAQRSIARKTILSSDKTFVKAMLGVAPAAWYAVQFWEVTGARSHAPQPWLRPSFRASRSAIDSRFKSRLKRVLDRAARK